MESSRRDLSNDMAEHRSILKNNQTTYHPRFGFTPKTSIAFPKTRFCFYCDIFIADNLLPWHVSFDRIMSYFGTTREINSSLSIIISSTQPQPSSPGNEWLGGRKDGRLNRRRLAMGAPSPRLAARLNRYAAGRPPSGPYLRQSQLENMVPHAVRPGHAASAHPTALVYFHSIRELCLHAILRNTAHRMRAKVCCAASLSR